MPSTPTDYFSEERVASMSRPAHTVLWLGVVPGAQMDCCRSVPRSSGVNSHTGALECSATPERPKPPPAWKIWFVQMK